MGQDANAVDNLRRTVLHQTIVGGDVGLALGGVNNQGVDFVAAAAQLDAGREAGAAQPGHAELVDALDKLFAGFALVVTPAVAFNPAVFTIGINDNAHLRQRGGVRRRMRSDGADDT